MTDPAEAPPTPQPFPPALPPNLKPVEVIGSQDARGVVQLADGTKISIRTVTVNVFQDLSAPGDPQGNPTYQVQTQAIISIVETAKK